MEPPECPVCLQSFDERDAIHRVLSCGHSVCQTCLAELPQPYPDTIRFPTCTQLVKYPSHFSTRPFLSPQKHWPPQTLPPTLPFFLLRSFHKTESKVHNQFWLRSPSVLVPWVLRCMEGLDSPELRRFNRWCWCSPVQFNIFVQGWDLLRS